MAEHELDDLAGDAIAVGEDGDPRRREPAPHPPLVSRRTRPRWPAATRERDDAERGEAGQPE
jgi:hypothetical protein